MADFRSVEVLPHLRTARFDRALSYAMPDGMTLTIGDVVRVPLGPRETYGYVIGADADLLELGDMRSIIGRIEGPPAFDASGLRLARWMAERYCCSLGEALAAVVFAGAIPRMLQRLVPAGERPDAARFSAVPPRLIRLIWDDFGAGFGLESLLRHPDARRAGDRATLLRAIGTLVRAGSLRRTRTLGGAKMREARERFLEPGDNAAHGPRARELADLVRTNGTLRRADALLAGFSNAVIAKALSDGALRESERRASRASNGRGRPPEFEATGEQRQAIARLTGASETNVFAETLVQGVTGSGKTFVYIATIARVIERGGRAIVLVPEIALTPQTAQRFEAAFGDRVAVLHSGLSERERFESWHAAGRGEKDVVVGARSAVFAPLPNLRLIVIDEAHERSYKQDSVPRYDAVAVARERMREADGLLVLGSATPPLEAYAAALAGSIGHVRLDARATAMPLPPVRIIDMARELERGNRRPFSGQLLAALERRLAAGEKSVLFVNRRGSGRFMLCRECGFVPECARCSVSLVAHRAENLLRCHLCDAQEALAGHCPKCGGTAFREFGIGTQRVAEAIAELYPSARIVRMDSDTTTRVGAHARLLDAFRERGDILVGTQMVAKGLDFPSVTLVGVVAADLDLHVADFRAAERTFDLVTQVAGRSGRGMPGEAIVQTYSPDHPAIAFAARHDFDGFAAQELEARRELGYPPFGELVYFGVVGRVQPEVAASASRYADALRSVSGVDVLGPAPYAVARVNDEWRYRFAAKAPDGTRVRAFIRETLQPRARRERTTRLIVNVDP